MENLLLIMLLAVVGGTTAVVGGTPAIPPLLDLSLTYNLDPEASHTIELIEKSMNRISINVELNQMCSSTHTGTHLEAPITFKNYSWSADNIPYERLWRVPGVVMDIERFVTPYYELTAEILQRWEDFRAPLVIPDGGILLIHTGFTPTKEKKSSEEEDDDDTETPYPQPRLSEDAGQWLANYGTLHGHDIGIIGVGIDLNSLDENDTNRSTSARAILYEKDIYALHNLKNLHLLPKSGFLVTVMPMKIHDGVGAPARVLAEREDTRPKPPVDGYHGSSEDEVRRHDWHSETDKYNNYPYSTRWGSPKDRVRMKSSATSDRCLFNPLIIGLPILMVLLGSL